MEDLFNKTFNINTEFQSEGVISYIYQYNNAIGNTTKNLSQVFCNVTTSLKSSANFNNECNMIKTFAQKLNPKSNRLFCILNIKK